jgi:SAM-dependent methyltransferase
VETTALARSRARYVAADAGDDFERERLDLLGRLMNPMTTRHLERLGIGRGWRCLDVGAGDGSVARWLAERVGPRGHVVATDLNPRFLGGLRGDVEVRQHDILHDDLETGDYDLVHCRALLMHLPEPERALARMVAALRPGGWLLVEEGDLGTFEVADRTHPATPWFDRIQRRTAETVHARGLVDLYFGRRCPALLEHLGLAERGDETTSWVCRGGEMGAQFQQMGLRLLGTLLEGGDVISAEHSEALQCLYGDPSFAFVTMAMVSAWGRRPIQGS